jgi:hypothetical protein
MTSQNTRLVFTPAPSGVGQTICGVSVIGSGRGGAGRRGAVPGVWACIWPGDAVRTSAMIAQATRMFKV